MDDIFIKILNYPGELNLNYYVVNHFISNIASVLTSALSDINIANLCLNFIFTFIVPFIFSIFYICLLSVIYRRIFTKHSLTIAF